MRNGENFFCGACYTISDSRSVNNEKKLVSQMKTKLNENLIKPQRNLKVHACNASVSFINGQAPEFYGLLYKRKMFLSAAQ